MTFTNEGLIATSTVNVNVKARFNDEIRRFAVPSATALVPLQAQIRGLFALAPQTALDLFYKDGDDDLVIMTSDGELQHALQHAAASLLRLEIVKKDGVALVPVPSPVAQVAPVQPLAAQPPVTSVEALGPFPHGPMGRFGKHGGCHARKMWKKDCSQGFQKDLPFGGRHGRCAARPERSNESCDRLKRKQHKCHKRDGAKPCKEKLTASPVDQRRSAVKLAPGTPFVQTWRIRNGGLDWPAGSQLVFVAKKGDRMNGPDFVPVQGPVPSNTEVLVSVNLVAPQEFGEYTGVWRMCTPEGKKFGKRLSVSVSVTSSSSSSESEDLVAPSGEVNELVSRLQALGLNVPQPKVERMMAKFEGNVDFIVERLQARNARWEERRQHFEGHHHGRHAGRQGGPHGGHHGGHQHHGHGGHFYGRFAHGNVSE